MATAHPTTGPTAATITPRDKNQRKAISATDWRSPDDILFDELVVGVERAAALGRAMLGTFDGVSGYAKKDVDELPLATMLVELIEGLEDRVEAYRSSGRSAIPKPPRTGEAEG